MGSNNKEGTPVFYVGTWGAFNVWDEVEYLMVDEKGKELKKKAKTTFAIAIEALNIEKGLIFLLDSLYKKDEASNYGEVLQSVEKDAREFLENVLKNSKDRDVLRKTEFFVAPSVGSFVKDKASRKRLITRCGAGDFYPIVYMKLAVALSDLLKEKRKFDVVLDISHGLNYTTALAFRALSDLVSGVNFFFEGIKLKLVNSEPYDRNAGVLIGPLQIHTILEESSGNIPRFQLSQDLKGLIKINKKCCIEGEVGEERLKEIGEKSNDVVSNFLQKYYGIKEGERWKTGVKVLASAIENGFPLLIYNFTLDDRPLSDFVKTVLDFYKDNTNVMESGGDLIISHMVNFGKDTPSIVKILFLAETLRDAYGISRKEEITLREFEKVKDLYKKYEPVYRRMEREYEKIRDGICDHLNSANVEGSSEKTENWKILADIISGKEEPPSDQCGANLDFGYFKRNFVAHAGVEKCSVEVSLGNASPEMCKEDKEKLKDLIFLRYSKDGKERAIKAASELLSS